jgi:hypothetical protein
MRLADAEVDILFVTKGTNVLYINENFKFDGRIVKIIYTGQSSHSELSVFVAFDDEESWALFTMKIGLELRLNYVLNSVHKHLAMDLSPPMLSPMEGYDTQYEYTYSIFTDNDGYIMENASGTKAYKVNISERLIESGDYRIG